MKFLAATILAGVFAMQPGLFAQSPVGIWSDEDKDTFEIYRDGAKLNGKILGLVPLNGPDGKPPTDKRNPDVSKRNVPVVGLVIIRDLKEASGGKWRDGTIYDPESGKTYSCSLQMKGTNILEVYGSYGPFWRTEHWNRVVGAAKPENKP